MTTVMAAHAVLDVNGFVARQALNVFLVVVMVWIFVIGVKSAPPKAPSSLAYTCRRGRRVWTGGKDIDKRPISCRAVGVHRRQRIGRSVNLSQDFLFSVVAVEVLQWSSGTRKCF